MSNQILLQPCGNKRVNFENEHTYYKWKAVKALKDIQKYKKQLDQKKRTIIAFVSEIRRVLKVKHRYSPGKLKMIEGNVVLYIHEAKTASRIHNLIDSCSSFYLS